MRTSRWTTRGLDYAAWLDLLRERGHDSVVIGGHSGGAVRAAYAQSKERYPGVVGIIPVSPGEYNHEGLIDLHADEFTNAYSWCIEQVESGSPDAYIRPGIPWGSSWTARAFIDCFNPDNRYSVTERASDLDCPALFVFGSEECGDGPQRLPVCGSGDAQSQAGRLPSRHRRGDRRRQPRLRGPRPPAFRDHPPVAGVDVATLPILGRQLGHCQIGAACRCHQLAHRVVDLDALLVEPLVQPLD